MAEAEVTVVIGSLADGPSPPAAGAMRPNVPHTRVADLAVAMALAAHYDSPREQCGYSDAGPREWRA